MNISLCPQPTIQLFAKITIRCATVVCLPLQIYQIYVLKVANSEKLSVITNNPYICLYSIGTTDDVTKSELLFIFLIQPTVHSVGEHRRALSVCLYVPCAQ